MELLSTVGMIVKGVCYMGYTISGLYLAGTGLRYYKDYKEYSQKEEV